MRAESNRANIETFLRALGARVRGEGRIYLAGGATAVLHGWRDTTIDVDLKPDPEPDGLFEAIAALKEELNLNIELASPDDFIPAIPGWRERSLFIARHGRVEFFHYDPYGQVLSKLQRRFDRDLLDAEAIRARGLIDSEKLRQCYVLIEQKIIRYPAIDVGAFRESVSRFCDERR